MERVLDDGALQQRSTVGRPWLPGQSGNPFGRPPVKNSLADLLRQAGEQQTAEGITYNQALCNRLWSIALTEPSAEHATTAIRYIFNRLLGTPTETIQQTTLNVTIEQVVMLLQSAGPMLASAPFGALAGAQVLALTESDPDDDGKEANGKDVT